MFALVRQGQLAIVAENLPRQLNFGVEIDLKLLNYQQIPRDAVLVLPLQLRQLNRLLPLQVCQRNCLLQPRGSGSSTPERMENRR